MIPLQGGLGLANALFGFFVILAVIIGIIYFAALPGYVFWKETKAWRTRKKVVVIFSYFILLSLATLVFWVLPDYYLENFHVDIIGSWFHQLSMYAFFALPLIYIVTIGAYRIITHRKQRVASIT